MTLPKIQWKPDDDFVNNANLTAYQNWLKQNYQLSFQSYDELWAWSVQESKLFWESLTTYFQVEFHSPYKEVYSDDPMPHVKWFPGATLNYAEYLFKNYPQNQTAIIFYREDGQIERMAWKELHAQVSALAQWMKDNGVQTGDRIAAYLPNIPEATVGFLAACSIGAIWSSCSPDFGSSSVVDRFLQIEPKVLLTVDGYKYGGKVFNRVETIDEIIEALPSLERVIEIPYIQDHSFIKSACLWQDVIQTANSGLTFEVLPFEHPIWILYSSGTTGQPKAITHSHGGVLLEHLKYVTFHNDVKSGEKYFWFTTTGWMMWNFVQATLLVGATIVLYDGSPGYPDMNRLWQMAADEQIQHFGTSAPFIMACLKSELDLQALDLSHLRSISSTGSPLPPEGFDWVYEQFPDGLWLCSMSGGTDVCSAFVGGCPTEPVFEGEIQRRALGCDMYAYSDDGAPVTNEVGEMVIVKPMPSMPIYFWNDPDKKRYEESYFEMFPGIWRHGDWLLLTDRNTLIIKGRSDATLNRHGIRIGTAEIYQAVDKIPEVKDSLVVNLEMPDGRHFMPLFVVMNPGNNLTKEIQSKIANQLRNDFTNRHVPDVCVAVNDLPYTMSGKKMEAPVKKILMGRPLEKSANLGATKNPESFDFFVSYYAEIQKEFNI